MSRLDDDGRRFDTVVVHLAHVGGLLADDADLSADDVDLSANDGHPSADDGDLSPDDVDPSAESQSPSHKAFPMNHTESAHRPIVVLKLPKVVAAIIHVRAEHRHRRDEQLAAAEAAAAGRHSLAGDGCARPTDARSRFELLSAAACESSP